MSSCDARTLVLKQDVVTIAVNVKAATGNATDHRYDFIATPLDPIREEIRATIEPLRHLHCSQ
jgi:hypothetical protein